MMATASSPESTLPWVEKYRPKNMNDIASQGTVVSVLRQSLQSDNLPHLLFYGPPGTGKTSTILALARELFGPTLFRSRILELNASDERGISVIREKVKNFAKVTVKETVPGFPCPPFKLIILDEADSLTSDAQTALRRTIEQYSRSTRFCLICNYVSKIIDPLTSRCAKFRFGPVESIAAVDRLDQISRAEGVKFEGDSESVRQAVLKKLIDVCGGDLRRAVTLLQGSHKLGKSLSVAVIDSMAGTVPSDVIQSALELWTEPGVKFSQLKSFIMDIFARSAAPPAQFLHQLVPLIIVDPLALPTGSNIHRALIVNKAAECEFRISEGADEIVQILDFFTTTRSILHPEEFVKKDISVL